MTHGLETLSIENGVETTRDGSTYFPTLYKKDSKGSLQFWRIFVIPNPDHSTGYDIFTEYGKVGGKEQTSLDSIFEGKNIGKANETTPQQQAVSEAKSRWTKQIERKGYVENKEDLDRDTRPGAEPMLAHRFDKYGDKIQYPCFIQPKLDGHRCIAVLRSPSDVKLYSRQRKPITGLPHIEKALGELYSFYRSEGEPLILDGELYNHDYKNNFEELTSHIRNESPKEGHEIVQYHLYDIVSDAPYSLRGYLLASLMLEFVNDAIKLVRTEVCEESEVSHYFKAFRAEGYEGAMLRNKESLYVGKRSYDLQKVKEFADDEFKIVGVEEGRGKMKGHAIFVCHTHEGKEFKAKMKGSMDALTEYFNNAEKYIGKLVTVQFQEYTKDGIPRFPVAIRFKETV